MVVREPPLLLCLGEAVHDVPHDVYRPPPGHKPPLERHAVTPLHEVRHRLPELVPARRVKAALDVDVVARLPAHEVRLAQITTNTIPTTAPATTPRTEATRESNDATASRPPKVEASNTTARAMILLVLNDTSPPSSFRFPCLPARIRTPSSTTVRAQGTLEHARCPNRAERRTPPPWSSGRLLWVLASLL